MRRNSPAWLLLMTTCSTLTYVAYSQQPFDLDPSFNTEINTWYVSSVMPLPDGDLLLSGQIRFSGDSPGTFRLLTRVDQLGNRRPWFPYSWGGGRIQPWNDQFYVGEHTVHRLLSTGLVDSSFIHMNADPYFSSLQGGDYHVYPDGRILMSGVHNLLDSIRGFEGLYCLVWFSNTGYLDTTKTHRTCAGSLDKFTELPNGQFIGSGSTGVWDGQQASNIIRFNTDGSLDPSFQANVNWGQAYGFLPLDDGRVYAAGLFRILGNPDTLRLARFTPDGSLDPSFNLLSFETVETNNGFGAIISKVYALDETRLIVVGGYERVNGETRKGICMIDTAGNLLDDHFVDAGCGYYDYQGFTHGSIDGFTQAPNGSYYIWGAYHGYDDGTTNDTTQRMVSRLYGLDVGISENANTQPKPELAIHPNPANGWVAFHYDLLVPPTDAYLIVQDLSGRELYRLQLLEEKHQIVWDTRSIGAGTYIVSLVNKERDLRSEKLVIQQ